MDPASLQVDDTENYFAFRCGFEVAFPSSPSEGVGGKGSVDMDFEREDMLHPLLLISREPFANVFGEKKMQSPDFMMVGANTHLVKGYYARFVHPVHQHKCILWSGYINMSKPQILSSGEYVMPVSFFWICMHVLCFFIRCMILKGLSYNILHAAAQAAMGSASGGGPLAIATKKRSRWSDTQDQAEKFDPFVNKKGVVAAGGKVDLVEDSLGEDDGDGDDDDEDDGLKIVQRSSKKVSKPDSDDLGATSRKADSKKSSSSVDKKKHRS